MASNPGTRTIARRGRTVTTAPRLTSRKVAGSAQRKSDPRPIAPPLLVDVLGKRLAAVMIKSGNRLRGRWALLATILVAAAPPATGMAILLLLTSGNARKFSYVLVQANLGALWLLSAFYLLRYIAFILPIVAALVLTLYSFRLVRERRFHIWAKLFCGALTLLFAWLLFLMIRPGADGFAAYLSCAGLIYFHLTAYYYQFTIWLDSRLVGLIRQNWPNRIVRRSLTVGIRVFAVLLAFLSVVLPITRLREVVPTEIIQVADGSSGPALQRGTVVSVDDSRLLLIRIDGELASIPIDAIRSRTPETGNTTVITGETTIIHVP